MTLRHKIPAGALLLAAVPLLGFLAACKTPTQDEVRAALEVVELKSSWVAKDYRQWPQPRLVLVPKIEFRVRNKTAEPLQYINFNAVFKKKNAVENLGDNFLAAVRKSPIPPGGLSEVITLKSNFGVEGRTLEQFKLLPQELTYDVKIFAQFKGSRHALLGEWAVSRDIDFKEDQPVHMEGKKIGKTEASKPDQK